MAVSFPSLLVISHTSQQGAGEACCPELLIGTDKKLQVKSSIPPAKGPENRVTSQQKTFLAITLCSSQTLTEKLHPSPTSFIPMASSGSSEKVIFKLHPQPWKQEAGWCQLDPAGCWFLTPQTAEAGETVISPPDSVSEVQELRINH